MPAFQIISDLHLEMSGPEGYHERNIEPRAPYLALLGDIGVANADHGEAYLSFLRRHLLRFRVVFLVMGNHEAYRSTWPETKRMLRDFEAQIREEREELRRTTTITTTTTTTTTTSMSEDSKTGDDAARGDGQERQGELGEFVLLDRNSYTIRTNPDDDDDATSTTGKEEQREEDTITVLGCTLFSHVPIHAAERVGKGLADFTMISDGWDVTQHNAAFQGDVAWLNEQVSRLYSSCSQPELENSAQQPGIGKVEDGGGKSTTVEIPVNPAAAATTTTTRNKKSKNSIKVVVFTHHCPTLDDRAIEPRHKGSLLSSGFCSDLSAQPCVTLNISHPASGTEACESTIGRLKQRLVEASRSLPFRRHEDNGAGDSGGYEFGQESRGIVKLWAFGHTHYNCDFVDAGKGKSEIRYYTNQQGYAFQQSPGYDEDRIVQV